MEKLITSVLRLFSSAQKKSFTARLLKAGEDAFVVTFDKNDFDSTVYMTDVCGKVLEHSKDILYIYIHLIKK